MGRVRNCGNEYPLESCPAVWVLNEPRLKTRITKYWQFYLCAINPGMEPRQVMAQLGYKRVLTNGTGFGDARDPRHNWITGENVNAPDPAFDKDRTTSRSMIMSLDGIEYDETFQFLGEWKTGYIILKTFNGNFAPPMKPGRSNPERLEDAKWDDYLYNPKDHWEMFFALSNVNKNTGIISPFSGGALYDWYFNRKSPVCFMPHVSREIIKYPLDYLVKLPIGTDRINPYTN